MTRLVSLWLFGGLLEEWAWAESYLHGAITAETYLKGRR